MPRFRTEAAGVIQSSPTRTIAWGIWCCLRLVAHQSTSVFPVLSWSRLLLLLLTYLVGHWVWLINASACRSRVAWWRRWTPVRFPPVPLSANNLGRVLRTYSMCRCHNERYNLIPVKERWCPAAGEVTVGLASHWPCVTDFSGLSTYTVRDHGLRKGDEQLAYTLRGVQECPKYVGNRQHRRLTVVTTRSWRLRQCTHWERSRAQAPPQSAPSCGWSIWTTI